jgi:hypothetical protein
MNQIILTEHQLSGARLTVPFTALGKFGPKHHAVIVGLHRVKQELWIAELSRKYGHRLVSLDQWITDNEKYIAHLTVTPNSGSRSNAEVAQSAIEEIHDQETRGSVPKQYDLIFNNCETFVDRHTKGEDKPKLSPQVSAVLQAAGIVIATGAVILQKQKHRK